MGFTMEKNSLHPLMYALPILAILVAGGYAWQGNKESNPVMTSEPTKNNAVLEKEHFIQQQDKKILDEINGIVPEEKIIAAKSHTERLKLSFERLHAIGDYFNRKALIEKELLALLEHQENIEEAQKILTDFQHTQNVFGKEQALARVYAIKLLETQAKHYSAEPLIQTTSALALNLNETLQLQEEITHNRLRDLEDLLRISLKHFESKGTLDQPENIALRLNYRKDYEPAIRDLYDDALFFPLLKQFGREKASQMVANIIDP